MDNKGKWVALLAGAAAGGIIGVLLTTEKGIALRKKLMDSAGMILTTVLETAGKRSLENEDESAAKRGL
jgi:galactokinase/mevalonate kinase-like predicted kinase